MPPLTRAAMRVLRWGLSALLVLLILAGAALALIESAWGKDRIRALIVSQANQYLTATLSIDELGGSLLRGISLRGISLAHDGRTLVSIDAVDVGYSIAELFRDGTTVRRISVTRPVVAASRLPDGTWDLSQLVRRNARQGSQSGPGRPLHLPLIEVTDATVRLGSPLTWGIAHLPSEFTELSARLSFDYQPVTWRLDFEQASWLGRNPTFDVQQLSGAIVNTPEALTFDGLIVQTPRSRLLVDGPIDRTYSPSMLALDVKAERFAFAEWAGIVPAVAAIDVEGPFTVQLRGPVRTLDTTLDLSGTGGAVAGRFTIDTTSPGWQARGEVTLRRLDLAKWLGKPENASDISGLTTFAVGMPPGSKFPRGTYSVNASHAAFMGYEADDVVARGDITAAEVRIAGGTATAYGANVRLDGGSIGIDSPFPFAFKGVINGIDLRQLPANVPVPHVESTLFFNYDVNGRFHQGFVRGTAAFQESTFLGVVLGAGAVGAIDTSAAPFTYSGEGDLHDIDLQRLGRGLGVAWMQEPRYEGLIDGHFHVDGAGSDAATMRLSGGGRLHRADLFEGRLSEADVGIEIAGGSLAGRYDGELTHVNPSLALNDERYAALLTGHGRGEVQVQDLMVRSPGLGDYTIDAALHLATGTEARGVVIDTADLTGRLDDSTLSLQLQMTGAAIEGTGDGEIAFDDVRSSNFAYDIRRAELGGFQQLLGSAIAGQIVTRGRMTGPLSASRFVGDGTVSNLEASGVKALSATLKYDATVPAAGAAASTAIVDGTLTFVEAFGQRFTTIAGQADYRAGRTTVDVRLTREEGPTGRLAGMAMVDAAARAIRFEQATVEIARTAWQLAPASPPPTVTWNERGIGVERVVLTDAGGTSSLLGFDGRWYPAGGSALHIRADRVSIDGLSARDNSGAPARFGGTLDADVVLSGSRAEPIVDGTFAVADGRVWRSSFERLEGQAAYIEGNIVVTLRLDQSPGVWATASGRLPADVLSLGRESEREMNVEVRSSRFSLGLFEGVTDVVRNVTGEIEANMTVVGSPKDPHLNGRLDVSGAGFLVAASGVRYQNGRVSLRFSPDQIAIETVRFEDRDGDALEVSGALATHELRVGDLRMAVRAKDFEVLRNEFGQMDIGADVTLQGQFEAPILDGRVTIQRGELRVDSILDSTLFRPYSTAAAPSPGSALNPDAVVVLNPWERLALNLELHVPGSLRLVGDNIQVSPGTPLGLGAINLRAIGDLYLYKGAGPAEALYVTGSLDSLTGTYAFQGRRFDLDPNSSINFRGDLNPDLYVTVQREISGVAARVTIQGLLSEPELRLASVPPLDQSDILSLIVFNTTTNELNASQQQQLAGRAATIAAGFLAAPILTAIEQSLGLDTLEIAPDTTPAGGTRVTIGNEIAPGLVARFSRQFGNDQYDEATIEYFLSRLFRLRASFSDASSLGTRSPFRRVERAGIDFLVFFSF